MGNCSTCFKSSSATDATTSTLTNNPATTLSHQQVYSDLETNRDGKYTRNNKIVYAKHKYIFFKLQKQTCFYQVLQIHLKEKVL